MRGNKMKKEIKEKFKKLYPNNRLLAVQLDGFTHRFFYDNGSDNSEIKCEYFSHCMPEGKWSDAAKEIFKDIPNYVYQNNPKEIIYIMPNKR